MATSGTQTAELIDQTTFCITGDDGHWFGNAADGWQINGEWTPYHMGLDDLGYNGHQEYTNMDQGGSAYISWSGTTWEMKTSNAGEGSVIHTLGTDESTIEGSFSTSIEGLTTHPSVTLVITAKGNLQVCQVAALDQGAYQLSGDTHGHVDDFNIFLPFDTTPLATGYRGRQQYVNVDVYGNQLMTLYLSWKHDGLKNVWTLTDASDVDIHTFGTGSTPAIGSPWTIDDNSITIESIAFEPQDPPTTDVPASDVPVYPTEPPVPATDVPATDVPATDVPATDVPATDVPASILPSPTPIGDGGPVYSPPPISDGSTGYPSPSPMWGFTPPNCTAVGPIEFVMEPGMTDGDSAYADPSGRYLVAGVHPDSEGQNYWYGPVPSSEKLLETYGTAYSDSDLTDDEFWADQVTTEMENGGVDNGPYTEVMFANHGDGYFVRNRHEPVDGYDMGFSWMMGVCLKCPEDSMIVSEWKEVTAEISESDGCPWNAFFTGYGFTATTELTQAIPAGTTALRVAGNASITSYKFEQGRELVLDPGGENEETVEVAGVSEAASMSQALNESGVLEADTSELHIRNPKPEVTGTENPHGSGTLIRHRPVFASTAGDPHVSTFFGEKYDM